MQPSDAPTRLVAFLFNDLLLCVEAESGAVHECIALAKVQIKLLHELEGEGGGGTYAFELWNISKVWRFAADSEEERTAWVEQIQQQVRFLLASFKQRGKSLAFLPQNVQALRQQLAKLHKQKETIEGQVLELTTGMCKLDAECGPRSRRFRSFIFLIPGNGYHHLAPPQTLLACGTRTLRISQVASLAVTIEARHLPFQEFHIAVCT